jgi:hypothetical protein
LDEVPPTAILWLYSDHSIGKVTQVSRDLPHVLVGAANDVSGLFSSVDTECIVSLKGRQYNYLVFLLEFVDYSSVSTGLLSITMSFIRWINRFAKVSAITKEQNTIIEASKVACDVIEFPFNVLVCFVESGGNDDKIFSEVNFCFGSSAAFVDNVISVN